MKSQKVCSGSSRGDIIALSSSEERDSVEKDVPNSQSLSGAAKGTSGGSDYEEKIISSSGRREIHEVKKKNDEENAVTYDDTENNSEVLDNDEKKNAFGIRC